MLQRLSISNYALIDNLDIHFSQELNLLTGETGAGKSIILGALSLILGQRAESRYFYNQEKKCVIEGSFAIADYQLQAFFQENDLDYEAETVLRREITADGKTRSFINDTPVNLATLKQLGEQLIDIHSQHATLAINNEDFQLLVLDTLAENGKLLQNYRNIYKQYRQVAKTLRESIAAFEHARAEQDYLQFQFDELERAALTESEQDTLEQELKVLEHAEEIKRSLLSANYLISESEQAALTQLKEAVVLLQGSEKYSGAIVGIAERLKSSLIELKDINAELEQLEQRTLVNEARTAEISERLDTIYSLQKKHRLNSIAELLALQDELSNKLNQILSGEEAIEQLHLEEKELQDKLSALSGELSAKRESVIPELERQVQEVLAEVGMPNAVLKVAQEPIEQLNETGADRIQFLFSANKGQAPMPMNKVASGGELSRLMLSIKSLIAKKTALPTIIFDEIDTGISGEVALKVGAIMEQLAQNMQVITITHLPQIASKGQKHFRVFKDESGSQTRTGIQELKAEDRVLEVAKMLSGENPGAFALQNAKELLAN
jgi:DNA repair protein RecN (Recombination protein N)